MKHLILFVFLAFSSIGSYACEIRAPGLTAEAKQALIVECEKAKLSQPPSMSTVTVDDVNKWADISQKFAGAIGIAAREIGVSVNEFIKTPAGMITVILIIWMSIGESLVILGVMVFIWAVVLISIRRIWTAGIDTVQRKFFGIVWEARVRRYLTVEDADDSVFISSALLLALGLTTTAITISNAF